MECFAVHAKTCPPELGVAGLYPVAPRIEVDLQKSTLGLAGKTCSIQTGVYRIPRDLFVGLQVLLLECPRILIVKNVATVEGAYDTAVFRERDGAIDDEREVPPFSDHHHLSSLRRTLAPRNRFRDVIASAWGRYAGYRNASFVDRYHSRQIVFFGKLIKEGRSAFAVITRDVGIYSTFCYGRFCFLESDLQFGIKCPFYCRAPRFFKFFVVDTDHTRNGKDKQRS